ncbi:MAG: prepilin-type N-terminal cleavage/methylation domain-containing protein [Tepidisphaeraceae bacterium]|jgi:prepilin-type N-terminal cleavage/methylation domain-containing protein
MSRRASHRGFTLVEVIYTLLLITIVIPVVMHGIQYTARLADTSQHRTEAAGLAQAQLNQLLADETWQGGSLSGDFSAQGWPQYTWQCNSAAWPGDQVGAGLYELDMVVSWSTGGRTQSVTVCTLAYPRNVAFGAATSSSTTATGG